MQPAAPVNGQCVKENALGRVRILSVDSRRPQNKKPVSEVETHILLPSIRRVTFLEHGGGGGREAADGAGMRARGDLRAHVRSDGHGGTSTGVRSMLLAKGGEPNRGMPPRGDLERVAQKTLKAMQGKKLVMQGVLPLVAACSSIGRRFTGWGSMRTSEILTSITLCHAGLVPPSQSGRGLVGARH